MSKLVPEVPTTIHHSHQVQQMDLGETIYLCRDQEARAGRILGAVYNWDDTLAGDPEEFEIAAIAFADKLVRAYNCHDELLATLKGIAPEECPVMTHHNPDQDRCIFCRALKLIAKAEGK